MPRGRPWAPLSNRHEAALFRAMVFTCALCAMACGNGRVTALKVENVDGARALLAAHNPQRAALVDRLKVEQALCVDCFPEDLRSQVTRGSRSLRVDEIGDEARQSVWHRAAVGDGYIVEWAGADEASSLSNVGTIMTANNDNDNVKLTADEDPS